MNCGDFNAKIAPKRCHRNRGRERTREMERAGQGAWLGSLNNGGLNQDRTQAIVRKTQEEQASGVEWILWAWERSSAALRHCGFLAETKMTRLLDLISKIICDKINNWVRLHILGKHRSPSPSKRTKINVFTQCTGDMNVKGRPLINS